MPTRSMLPRAAGTFPDSMSTCPIIYCHSFLSCASSACLVQMHMMLKGGMPLPTCHERHACVQGHSSCLQEAGCCIEPSGDWAPVPRRGGERPGVWGIRCLPVPFERGQQARSAPAEGIIQLPYFFTSGYCEDVCISQYFVTGQ